MNLISQLVIPNLKPTTRGIVQFEVTMNLDISGFINLKVEYIEDGEKKEEMKEAKFVNERLPEEFTRLLAHLDKFWP